MFFTFDYWLERAKKGDNFAVGHMWAFLARAVQSRTLSEAQWHFLDDLLLAVSAESGNGKLCKAANSALALGRRRGRKPAYLVEADEAAMADAVFARVGEVHGKDLDDACEAVLAEIRGHPGAAPPDLRAIKKAYVAHLPHLRFLQRLAGENDEQP